MLQRLIYSIFVFLSSKFPNFYVFIFRIIFGRTCYGTTVNFETNYLWVSYLETYEAYEGRMTCLVQAMTDNQIPH